jgi:Cu2+-exporting ATPase
LDKTGTITIGKPSIEAIRWKVNIEVERQSQVLLSIQKNSEHPLAEPVICYLERSGQNGNLPVKNIESITGKGIKAVVNDQLYFVGNKKLMGENKIDIDNEISAFAEQWQNEAKTVFYFADSNNALAVIAVSDQIKESSVEAIKQLQNLGIEVYMLTGDNDQTARAIASVTGIDSYKAEVLPQAKYEFISELQKKGKIVAMVGDGINDSQALAQADVSIAMGKGSDIAIDVAKMTIISSDLLGIPKAIKLSKYTVATIKQNLFWAFVYNIIAIPVAAGILYPVSGFLLNPMIAGAAMALSSVSVVSNSLRLRMKSL